MKKIDAVGIDCPKPVIMVKKEFDNMEEGSVQVLADNKACVMNLEKFAKSNNFEVSHDQIADDRWEVTITKGEGQGKEIEIPEDLDLSMSHGNEDFVLAVGTKYYGTGDEEFGESLMRSFIYTVSESKPYPKKMIFFNAGIFLTTKGSDVIDDIRKLEENGVEIVSCGACLDYYEKTEDLEVGEVSNMYTIYESLRDAGRNMIIA